MDREKKKRLKERIRQYVRQDVMVAFSGGTDSSLLLKMVCEAAQETGKEVYGVTVQTRLHPVEEIRKAAQTVQETGARHLVVMVDELMEAGIGQNPVDRCYLCKKCLFDKIKKTAADRGISMIMDGTNEDDLHVYRPGLRALKELGIISPLAEEKVTKAEVRELAEEYGLSVASKPAMPCLATRFPYGTALTYEKLEKVEKGEAFIRKLGFYNLRLRIHGDIARIEVDEQEIAKILQHREEIIRYLRQLGYSYVTLDLEGFRSGSMDEVL